jgi:methionyl aminopeptidase
MIQRNDPCWCGSGKKYKKCHLFEDEKNKATTQAVSSPGKPKTLKEKKFVKSPREIAGMERAGAFNGELLDYIRPFVKAGISTAEIDELVHTYTVEHGNVCACLGYHGYPKSVCTSINNIVCHGIPSEGVVLKDGDIVNVDLTSIVDGFYGDSSETFFIGSVPQQTRHLVMVTAEALMRGIDAARPGVPLSAIAEAIEPFVNEKGCSVVHQYTGHGIGKKFHEYFSVYHHRDPDADKITLLPGMTLTIEPMINMGGWEVITDRGDGWTVRTADGSLSAQFEHTICITDGPAKVLTLTPSQKAAGVRLSVDGVNFS